ncbi:MAG: mercuric transport protein MerTP [Ignavibacteria bacterium]|jgi:copper chaperone CopZ|nr:mercuric transport protein MerTP [Ignavibacteria bacterium]
MKKDILLTGGVFASVLSSICCIAPVLTLAAGVGGAASAFSWLGPARPYLAVLSVAVLGFAWFQNVRTKQTDGAECACDTNTDGGIEHCKPSFWQTKTFLGIVTTFSLMMIAFPLYSHVFFQKQEQQDMFTNGSDVQKVTFAIKGMTCTGCETTINSEVRKLDGIVSVATSYNLGNSVVEYDKSKIAVGKIEDAINSTGYTVTKTTVH